MERPLLVRGLWSGDALAAAQDTTRPAPVLARHGGGLRLDMRLRA